MSLIADKKQTLKRAIRSKDFETLLSFIPYDIPVVDSLFATCDVDIAIATYTKGNTSYGRNIDEVEDFDDRNIIKIYKVGDYDREWSSKKDVYKDYFINKCAFKHEMPWAMSKVYLDFEKIARSYPVKQQMLAISIENKRCRDLDSWLHFCVITLIPFPHTTNSGALKNRKCSII